MPPRYSYWTILAGGLPTSFRSAERHDLLPTLRRLQERHPDAEMKWFQRGRLWQSPEDAKKEFEKAKLSAPRGRNWRPGGEHRDPREAFKKKKRERNQARRQKRFERKHDDAVAKRADRSKPESGTRSSSPRPRIRHSPSRESSKRRPRR
jgi:hypothetical protein